MKVDDWRPLPYIVEEFALIQEDANFHEWLLYFDARSHGKDKPGSRRTTPGSWPGRLERLASRDRLRPGAQ